MDFPLEGDFFEDSVGNLYEVKGFAQPADSKIGFIRYLNSTSFSPVYLSLLSQYPSRSRLWDVSLNEITSDSPTNLYHKIYSIQSKFAVMKQFLPEREFIHPNYYFPLQHLADKEIKHHILPESFLNQVTKQSPDFSEHSEIEPLFQATMDFCDWIIEHSNIPKHAMGITGSLLLGMATPESDLDLIVYGFANSLKVREVLRDHFRDAPATDELRKYTLSEFKQLYQSRVDDSGVKFFDFLKYEHRKLHQGKFREYDYFLRFFEFPTREEYEQANVFDNTQIRNLGRIHFLAEIRNDQYWWTTPARVYPINIDIKKFQPSPEAEQLLHQYDLKPNMISHTFSLRGRFTENVRLLEQISCLGQLELVIPSQKPPFLQVSLGGNPKDFLVFQ